MKMKSLFVRHTGVARERASINRHAVDEKNSCLKVHVTRVPKTRYLFDFLAAFRLGPSMPGVPLPFGPVYISFRINDQLTTHRGLTIVGIAESVPRLKPPKLFNGLRT